MPNLDLFFLSGAGVCAIMVVIWLIRSPKVGPRAIVMACAFVVMGGLMLAMRAGLPQNTLIGIGILLAILLGTDVAMRAMAQAKGERR